MSTLLVIGNGFDLKLGAKTQYKDFFTSSFYSKTKTAIDNWILEFDKYVRMHLSPNMAVLEDHSFTCWDLLFYLVSTNGILNINADDIKWCDIEKVIHESLISYVSNQLDSNETDYFSFGWRSVLDYFDSGVSIDALSYDRPHQMMCFFLAIRYRGNFDLFQKLLEELVVFEKKFGQYIAKATNTKTYQSKSNTLVKRLCQSLYDIYVDSFNYSDF